MAASSNCSQDCRGVSGELVLPRLSLVVVDWRVEIFLFFEEDVLTASCVSQL